MLRMAPGYEIAQVAADHPMRRTMRLRPMDTNMAAELAAAVPRSIHLQRVEITGYHIGNESTARELASALAKSRSVVEIVVKRQDQNEGAPFLTALLRALAHATTSKSLSLTDAVLVTPAVVSAFCELVKTSSLESLSLRRVQLSDARCRDALRYNQSLRKVSIHELGRHSTSLILTGLLRHPTLRHLVIESCSVQRVDHATVQATLASLSSLRELDLELLNVDTTLVQPVLKGVQRSPGICRLKLWMLHWYVPQLDLLASTLAACPSIADLSLGGDRFGHKHVWVLTSAMKAVRRLEVFRSRSREGDRTASLLASLLSKGSLLSLKLVGGYRGDREPLLHGLHLVNGLEELELRDCLGLSLDEVAKAFFRDRTNVKRLALPGSLVNISVELVTMLHELKTTSCEVLEIPKTRIPIYDAEVLADHLARSSCPIRKLVLDDCRLTPKSMAKLLRSFVRSPRLEEVYLFDNHFGEVGTRALIECLPQWTHLRRLGFTWDESMDDVLPELLEAFSANKSLMDVVIHGDLADGRWYAQLQHRVRSNRLMIDRPILLYRALATLSAPGHEGTLYTGLRSHLETFLVSTRCLVTPVGCEEEWQRGVVKK